MKKLNVALLAGGCSVERDISIKSGDAVYEALNKKKYTVRRYDPKKDLDRLFQDRKSLDLAIVLVHGKYGEDGRLQGMLDMLEIPFLGSGVLTSAMAMNKRVAKDVFRNAGIPVVPDVVLCESERWSAMEVFETLGPSLVVKPISQGSSVGTSICHREEDLASAVSEAFRYGDEVIVEKFIPGREVTCGVLGNQDLETLPLVEIESLSPSRFFDQEAKYEEGAAREICPARIEEDMGEKVRSYARTAHQALKCRVWSRTDMILDKEGQAYVLEINTIPGMTERSLIPLAARAAGMSLGILLDRMVELALESKAPWS
jgi:D-alanine-D-alanine ligase